MSELQLFCTIDFSKYFDPKSCSCRPISKILFLFRLSLCLLVSQKISALWLITRPSYKPWKLKKKFFSVSHRWKTFFFEKWNSGREKVNSTSCTAFNCLSNRVVHFTIFFLLPSHQMAKHFFTQNVDRD
jgi:hypothetical protein